MKQTNNSSNNTSCDGSPAGRNLRFAGQYLLLPGNLPQTSYQYQTEPSLCVVVIEVLGCPAQNQANYQTMSALYTMIAVVIIVSLLVYVHKKYVRISLPAGNVIRRECLPEEGKSEAEIVDDDDDEDKGEDNDNSADADADADIENGGDVEMMTPQTRTQQVSTSGT